MSYSIRLLTTSALDKNVLVEACGSDSYRILDGRIKNINTAHEKAFNMIHSLRNIRGYCGFNVYLNDKLIQVNKLKDFINCEYKQI